MSIERKPIVILGPTASGKSDSAMSAAISNGNTEIVVCDAMQVYKRMDIGTAKPTAAELAVAPHHLIDIRDPLQSYSAADFRSDALRLIAEIQQRGALPLLVGGTMLYFKALLEGLSPLPPADPQVRQRIEQQAAELGWEALHQQLAETPGFFDQDPVVIDVSALALVDDETIDLARLMAVLREYALVPLAIKGAPPALLSLAKGAGLVDATDARIRRSMPIAEAAPTQAPVVEPVAPAPMYLSAMRIDKPLRSGQQIYAKGRDLIVMGMVNAGAEVIADGHIHVYGALRGKAIAGARGNTQAQIFAQVMEPELISIAGVYRTSENPLPKDVLGQPAQVSLQSGPDGDKLLITPLKN